jgi:hypothetical protein
MSRLEVSYSEIIATLLKAGMAFGGCSSEFARILMLAGAI